MAEYRSRLAGVHTNLSLVELVLGRHEAAIAEARTARDLQLKLVEAHPNATDHLIALAGTYADLGEQLDGLGRRAEALVEYRRARDVHADWSRPTPVRASRFALAARTTTSPGCCMSWGRATSRWRRCSGRCACWRNWRATTPRTRSTAACSPAPAATWATSSPAAGRPTWRVAEYRRARDLQTELVAAQPDVPETQHELALTHNALAGLLTRLGRRDEAIREYGRAGDVEARLVKAHPEVPGYREIQAHTHHYLGNLLEQAGRPDRALEEQPHSPWPSWATWSRPTVTSLVIRPSWGTPATPSLRCWRAGRTEDALREYRQARELLVKRADALAPADLEGLARVLVNHGWLLALTGRHRDGLAELDRGLALLAALRLATRPTRISPRSSALRCQRVSRCWCAGRPGEALVTWGRVLARSPAAPGGAAVAARLRRHPVDRLTHNASRPARPQGEPACLRDPTPSLTCSWRISSSFLRRLVAAAQVLGQERLAAAGRSSGSPAARSRGPRPRTAGTPPACPPSCIASTICSLSACLTRGSFAPWAISSGILILSALNSGERDFRNSSSFSRSPTRTANSFFIGSQYGGIDFSSVTRFDGPTMLDGAGERVRRERRPDQRRVAAVAAAHDRHLLRVGVALLDGPVDGVDQVVVHLAGPLAVAGVEELLAEAGRAAEVHLQHRVAAVGQPLRLRVVAPAVARPRPAVDQQHHRQVLRLDARPAASGSDTSSSPSRLLIVTGFIGASLYFASSGLAVNSFVSFFVGAVVEVVASSASRRPSRRPPRSCARWSRLTTLGSPVAPFSSAFEVGLDVLVQRLPRRRCSRLNATASTSCVSGLMMTPAGVGLGVGGDRPSPCRSPGRA